MLKQSLLRSHPVRDSRAPSPISEEDAGATSSSQVNRSSCSREFAQQCRCWPHACCSMLANDMLDMQLRSTSTASSQCQQKVPDTGHTDMQASGPTGPSTRMLLQARSLTCFCCCVCVVCPIQSVVLRQKHSACSHHNRATADGANQFLVEALHLL